MKHLAAITSCAREIAHTLLATEALEKTAAAWAWERSRNPGWNVRVAVFRAPQLEPPQQALRCRTADEVRALPLL